MPEKLAGQRLFTLEEISGQSAFQPVYTYEVEETSGLGCRDMVGNISEWCADPFETDYRFRPYHELDIDPRPPLAVCHRTIRGGSCNASFAECRVTWRAAAKAWESSSATARSTTVARSLTFCVVRTSNHTVCQC